MSKYVMVELVYKNIITIVEEEEIKEGIFFGENDDVLTLADPEIFDKWQEVKDNYNFDDILQDNYCYYEKIDDNRYYSIEEINELRNKYKYFYNSFNNEYMTIDNFGIYDYDLYYQHYNGSSYDEFKIDIIAKNVELIESDLCYKDIYNRTGKYELYKIDGKLTLIYNSFYRGSMLKIVNEITPEELKNKFDYEI